MTCPDCPHAAHAGRCWRWTGPTLCACTRKDKNNGRIHSDAQPTGGGGALRPGAGAASDLAGPSLAELAWELGREAALLGEASRDVLSAAGMKRLLTYGRGDNDLEHDLEKDRADGGLGSGRWLGAENP